MLPVYVNFTLHVNSQRLCLLGQLKNKYFSASALSIGVYDVTNVGLVAVLLENTGVYLRPGV